MWTCARSDIPQLPYFCRWYLLLFLLLKHTYTPLHALLNFYTQSLWVATMDARAALQRRPQIATQSQTTRASNGYNYSHTHHYHVYEFYACTSNTIIKIVCMIMAALCGHTFVCEHECSDGNYWISTRKRAVKSTFTYKLHMSVCLGITQKIRCRWRSKFKRHWRCW